MTSIRSTILLLALLSLVACEQAASPPAQSKTEASTVRPMKAAALSTAAIRAEPAGPALNNAGQKSASAQQPPITEGLAKPDAITQAREPEPAEPKAPLDLKLRPNVFDPLQSLPLHNEESTLLPPLFTEQGESTSGFQLNGKLISNERDDDYWQSVEGAQLQFEFKQ